MLVGRANRHAPLLLKVCIKESEIWRIVMSDQLEQSKQELINSGMGIASFIISITAGVLIFIMLIVAGAMEASAPGGIDEESALAIILGLFIIALILADLVALGLGIAGLIQKNTKKIFATLGTIFSSVTIVLTIALIIIGNTM
jgi:hypothetical protein